MPALGVLIRADEGRTIIRTKISYIDTAKALEQMKHLKIWVNSAYRNTMEVKLPANETPMAINNYIANRWNQNGNYHFIDTEVTKSTGEIFQETLVSIE